MKLAKVWIEHPNRNIDQPFSYLADGFDVVKGVRVEVDFNNRRLIGFVDQVEESPLSPEQYAQAYDLKLKTLIRVIDSQPLINEELYQLGSWMAQATISPRIACYQAMLPNKLSPKSNNQRIKMLEYVRFQNTLLKLTGKQQAALKALENDKELLCADWRKLFGPSVTKTLIDKGCVLLYQREARYQAETVKPLQTPLKLTVYQQAAFDEIVTTDDPVYLLHGATGSGKTEIYLQLAQQKVAAGEQVLIMVPEISLTPQMVERVKQRFGDRVAIYHSALNDQQKYEQFMRVYDQEVAVVVGTRSAAFMPFKKLGLIVLDEEHDHSYKQESTPCYHCRDIVLRRGAYHHCKVILGSATPALESYARAQKKVYHLISLPQRINDQPLPVCRVVDVRSMLRKGLSGIITLPLEEAIKARLLKKEQIIILLNRRGYTPLQQCVECSSVIMCPDCDIAMNYHKDKNLLVCHTCGRMMALPKTCPVCHGQHWTHSGFGTQKLEEEMVRLFPQAKILRMDADTVRRKNGHQRILERFGSHEADILVGTQMIAKGLDYPSVTLVGVINADAALAHSDFRSVETTFDLIVQASGRSGRGLAAGEVIIQAYDVQHYVIQTASRHDYQKFYAYEMQYRHAGNYPPYTYLISIVFTHTRLETMQSSVQQLAEDLRLQPEYKVLGPSELYRTFNKCRLRIILKGKNLEAMIAAVTNQLHDFQKANGAVSILVDVNPLRVE